NFLPMRAPPKVTARNTRTAPFGLRAAAPGSRELWVGQEQGEGIDGAPLGHRFRTDPLTQRHDSNAPVFRWIVPRGRFSEGWVGRLGRPEAGPDCPAHDRTGDRFT